MPSTRRTRDELLVYRDPDPLGRHQEIMNPRTDMPILSPGTAETNGSIHNLGDQQLALRGGLDSIARLEQGLGDIQNPLQRQPGSLDDQRALFGKAFQQGGVTPAGSPSHPLFQEAQQPGMFDGLAMRLQNAHAIGQGTLPFWAQLEKHQLDMDQQRGQLGQQLLKAQQDRIQKLDDKAIELWTKPDIPTTTRKKLSEQLRVQGSTIAGNLLRLGDDQLLGELETLRPLMEDGEYEQWTELMKAPNANLVPLEQRVGVLRKERDFNSELVAKTNQLSKLVGLDSQGKIQPGSSQAYQLIELSGELEKHQNALEEARANIKRLGLGNQQTEQTIAHHNVMNPIEQQKGRLEMNRLGAPIISSPFYNAAGETQNIQTDPKTGKRTTVGGVPFSKTQQTIMSSAMQKERADTIASMTTLQDVLNNFHPDFVGTGNAAWNTIKRAFGKETTRTVEDGAGNKRLVKEAEFRTGYDAVIKILRKEMMGTAQSVHELSANPMAFPAASDIDADVTIPYFFKNQYQALARKLESQNSVVAEQRRQNPIQADVRLRQLMDYASATTTSGDNVLGLKSKREMKELVAERLAEEIQNGWVIQ